MSALSSGEMCAALLVAAAIQASTSCSGSCEAADHINGTLSSDQFCLWMLVGILSAATFSALAFLARDVNIRAALRAAPTGDVVRDHSEDGRSCRF